ncbi:MAG: MFS transporter [Flavobacteriales bacterium]|nr:MFS transporter [Flavobacteriales bacterium]
MDRGKNTAGLKENLEQFTLLIVVNAFVGGMVGLERSIFFEFAEQEFGISSTSAIMSFIVAFGVIAERYGLTPYPFYLGIGIVCLGLLLSAVWIRDTRRFVQTETRTNRQALLSNVYLDTSFRHITLSSVTQAGLVNNLNDGMIWGSLPILLLTFGYNNAELGVLTAIYPAVWGIGQLFTGKMADHSSRKDMLFWGMLLQGIAILVLPISSSFIVIALVSVSIGIGTALVYPTLLTVIASTVNPQQRAESLGCFDCDAIWVTRSERCFRALLPTPTESNRRYGVLGS